MKVNDSPVWRLLWVRRCFPDSKVETCRGSVCQARHRWVAVRAKSWGFRRISALRSNEGEAMRSAGLWRGRERRICHLGSLCARLPSAGRDWTRRVDRGGRHVRSFAPWTSSPARAIYPARFGIPPFPCPSSDPAPPSLVHRLRRCRTEHRRPEVGSSTPSSSTSPHRGGERRSARCGRRRRLRRRRQPRQWQPTWR